MLDINYSYDTVRDYFHRLGVWIGRTYEIIYAIHARSHDNDPNVMDHRAP